MRPVWLVLVTALCAYAVSSPDVDLGARIAAGAAVLMLAFRAGSMAIAAAILGGVAGLRIEAPLTVDPSSLEPAVVVAVELDAPVREGRSTGWARLDGMAMARATIRGLDVEGLSSGARLLLVARVRGLDRRATPDRRSAARSAAARRHRVGLVVREVVAISDPGSPGLLDRLRRDATEAIDSRMGGSAGLWRALVLADRVGLDDAARDAVQSLGMAHLLALSGMHTSIVAGALLWPLRRRGRAGLALVLPVLVAWVVVAGGGASLVRAVGMAAWWVLARRRGVRADVTDAVGAVALLELTVRPHLLCGVGWWLSYVATLAVVRVARATARWPRPCAAIAVSCAAQTATAPWVLDAFGFVNLAAPLTLLLVGPVFAGALVTGLGVLAGGAAIPWLIPWLDPLATLSAHAFGLSLRVVEATRALTLQAPGLDGIQWVVAVTSVAAVLVPISAHRRSRAGLAFTGVVVAFATGAAHREWIVFDVGQGDASVLRCGRGVVVVDTGPRYEGRSPAEWTVLDWLERRRVKEATVVLTHAHQDHTGGLASLLGSGRVGRVVMARADSGRAWCERVSEAGALAGAATAYVERGDSVAVGEEWLEVLWPPASAGDLHANDRSIVLGWHAGRVRALLAGDLERRGEARLLDAGTTGRRRWLKVAHHGGDTGTDGPWLDRLGVRTAFVSSGAGNRYGHPDPVVIERLQSVGARVWRTDTHGFLRLRWSGEGGGQRIDCGRGGPP